MKMVARCLYRPRVYLTMLLSDLLHTFCQTQTVVIVTTVDLSHVLDVSYHGLVVLMLFIEGFSHI